MYNFFSSRLFSILPSALATVIVFGLSLLVSGCYTVKQGTTMIGYLGRAVPLEVMAKSGSGSRANENSLFARRVEDIRRFAMEELGLKESKNYTRYVELDRNYLAAVVSASPPDSFAAYEWWFPIVGRVPYKGFFNIEDAYRERAKLENKGLDAWIRGVGAFSTLGWFKDPLYSYMKEYSLWELADLIIHELVHATVYIKNQSKFNEGIAQFIGTEGARLYIERSGDDMQAERAYQETYKADDAVFLIFIRGLIAELSEVYENPALSKEEKIYYKAEIIAASKKRFEESYDEVFQTRLYRGFFIQPVNNALLGHYRLYYEEDTWFQDLYEKSGGNLRDYITAAKTLNEKTEKKAAQIDPWLMLEKALGMR
ncbi:MAG: aminopeptidase [Treponema sp.]|jgi:predicted aminopeptidase|nr:aminopeptidase [Treponema sp.]